MKVNTRYEPQIKGNLTLNRLFGNYHFTIDGVSEVGQTLDYLNSPIVAHINATKNCNLNCHYCYARTELSNQYEMSLDEYMHTFDLLRAAGVFVLYISGGEPSTNPNISAILKYAIDCGFVIVLLTNLIDIQNYDIDLLKSKQIQVQLGLNEIWHNNREAYPQLKIACENYRLLQNRGVKVSATIMIDVNHICVPDLLKYLVDNEVYTVRFGIMVREGKMQNYRITSDYLQYVVDTMHELVMLREQFPSLNISIQNEPQTYTDELFSRRMECCEAGTSQIYIDCDGTVYPCPLFKNIRDFQCGNILCDSISKIWQSEALQLFRSIKMTDTGCEDCHELCGVWCRGLTYSYTGKISGHSPFCYKHILKRE